MDAPEHGLGGYEVEPTDRFIPTLRPSRFSTSPQRLRSTTGLTKTRGSSKGHDPRSMSLCFGAILENSKETP